MLRKLIALTILISPSMLSAQGLDDALRLSQSVSSGTARYVSMGGAFGALGADFATLSSNPAGLGVYRTSEFMFTPSFKFGNTNTTYMGSSTTESYSNLSLDNLGFVLAFETLNPNQDKGLVNVNMGFGYNRLVDFYSSDIAQGSNTNSSALDYYAQQADGWDSWNDLTSDSTFNAYRQSNAPWDAILAWDLFLIDEVDNYSPDNMYYRAALEPGDGVDQDHIRTSVGRVGEYVVSLGMNFSHKFYLGATFGMQDVYLRQTVVHSEQAFDSNPFLSYINDRFYEMEHTKWLNVDGSGYNFKIGGIVRPIPELRIGMAFHTPTYYRLTESYSESLYSDMHSGSDRIDTPNSFFDYRIENPYKAIASLAYTFSNIGLISAEVEYLDYSTARFGSSRNSNRFSAANRDIQDLLTNTVNIKGGGEIWISDVALRAGFGWYGSPFDSGLLNSNAEIIVLSGGVGYRTGSMFIDAAYQHQLLEDKYLMYLYGDPVGRSQSLGRAMLSVGFKF